MSYSTQVLHWLTIIPTRFNGCMGKNTFLLTATVVWNKLPPNLKLGCLIIDHCHIVLRRNSSIKT